MVIDPSKPFDLAYRVDPTYDRMRLDQYVRAVVPSLSRTKIQRYNDEDRITVNGVPRRHNWRVRTGDEVVLKCRIPAGGEALGRDIPVEIVYEDEWLLAVNKQPGLVVHPVALHRHDTLMNALHWRYEGILPEGKELSLVNRIDKLTSGVVLVSKDIRAKRHLQEQFEARSVYKTYLAVTDGIPAGEQGEIDLPLGPKLRRRNRCLMDVRRDVEGKPSRTAYWVLERFPGAGGQGHALVRFAPKTGRQHQLRVHARAMGWPLTADHLYGDGYGRRWVDARGDAATLERFCLHAETLDITHPVTGEPVRFRAPLAPDMAGLLAALRAGRPLQRFALADLLDAVSKEPHGEESEGLEYGQTAMGDHEFDHL
jgi:23S rRNA pseudouridine1911/1915/1917 synthase